MQGFADELGTLQPAFDAFTEALKEQGINPSAVAVFVLVPNDAKFRSDTKFYVDFEDLHTLRVIEAALTDRINRKKYPSPDHVERNQS